MQVEQNKDVEEEEENVQEQRKNETFWKVFSTLYEENHHKYSFNDHLLIMSSFANFYPLTTMHLYTLFEKYNLSAPQIQENQQLKLQHYSTDE